MLHWHLTDIESFPVQSERYPALSGKGAFRPDLIYTKADLTEVVRYGGLRGVRIMPEFDVPGHAGWAFGAPSVEAHLLGHHHTARSHQTVSAVPVDTVWSRTAIGTLPVRMT